MENLENNDIKSTLKLIDEVYYSGKNLEIFLYQTIEKLISLVEENNHNYIHFLKPISEILKDIKYSEEKITLVKLGFISLFATQPIYIQPKNKEISQNDSKNAERKAEKIEEKNFQKLLEELKLKGDLSLFVGLSFANIFEDDEKIKITFPDNRKLHYEIIKEKKGEIEKLYYEKFGKRKNIEISISESQGDDVLEKLKTLFGEQFKIEED